MPKKPSKSKDIPLLRFPPSASPSQEASARPLARPTIGSFRDFPGKSGSVRGGFPVKRPQAPASSPFIYEHAQRRQRQRGDAGAPPEDGRQGKASRRDIDRVHFFSLNAQDYRPTLSTAAVGAGAKEADFQYWKSEWLVAHVAITIMILTHVRYCHDSECIGILHCLINRPS